MKIIGITGGIGAGKTQVLEYLNSRYGATVCQADEVAKKLQKKGGACYDAIVEHFGQEILDEKGELDRARRALSTEPDRTSGGEGRDPEEDPPGRKEEYQSFCDRGGASHRGSLR